MRASSSLLVLALLGATACDGAINGGLRTHHTPRMPDGGMASEGISTAGSSIPGSREICGNGVDDDGNGQVDEGCSCDPGSMRSCYIGAPGTSGVGACRDGMQMCTDAGEFSSWGPCTGSIVPTHEIADNGVDDNCDGNTDEPGGICVPTSTNEFATTCGDHHDNDCDTLVDCADPDCHDAPGCPSTCASTETLCYGGIDDDCNGLTDCADPSCAADPACAPSPCPAGQTPTYHLRVLPPSGGASGVEAGDHMALMTMTCETGGCSAGQDNVEVTAGTFACVPRAPTCPSGTFANYSGGMWSCTGGCDYIIHYGGIYGGQTICASAPPPCDASSGLVPTFVYETSSWACVPMCDGGLYDPHYVDGILVCVPC